jgi:quercetin dioxygenase-like cupin family protein
MHTPARTITHPVFGDEVTFTHTTATSDGQLTELHITLQPGGGNEPHFHQEFAETFTAIEGPLGLLVDGKIHQLAPGETMTADIGVVHRFFNDSDQPVQFRVTIKPGHQGFEHMLRIMYGLANDGLANSKGLPRNLYHLGILSVISDTRLPGPLKYIGGVFRWFGQRGIKRGTYEALQQQYCR